jgi:hypothetical protein
MKRLVLSMLLLAFGVQVGVHAQAQAIPVPNGSFESPAVPPGWPATTQVDAWNKFPQPDGVTPPGGMEWDQLTGSFPNLDPSSPSYITNADGDQVGYLFALGGVGLYQELDDVYQAGLSYHLAVGLRGGGFIGEGDTLELSLYYRDNQDVVVPIATSAVAYNLADFPPSTLLIDRMVHLPEVGPDDAWAGRNIGIQFLATSGAGNGYWDLDNVRLTAVPEPGSVGLLVLGAATMFLWRRRRQHAGQAGSLSGGV